MKKWGFTKIPAIESGDSLAELAGQGQGGALAVAAMARRGKKRRGRKLEVGGLLTLAGR
jgi:hypothetical protein